MNSSYSASDNAKILDLLLTKFSHVYFHSIPVTRVDKYHPPLKVLMFWDKHHLWTQVLQKTEYCLQNPNFDTLVEDLRILKDGASSKTSDVQGATNEFYSYIYI